MTPDDGIRMAARVLSVGLSVEEFARALSSSTRLELVAAFVRAEGFCWVCDGALVLGWSDSDNKRALERRKADGWELTATGCTGCDPVTERLRAADAERAGEGARALAPIERASPIELAAAWNAATAVAPHHEHHRPSCLCTPCTGRRSS